MLSQEIIIKHNLITVYHVKWNMWDNSMIELRLVKGFSTAEAKQKLFFYCSDFEKQVF